MPNKTILFIDCPKINVSNNVNIDTFTFPKEDLTDRIKELENKINGDIEKILFIVLENDIPNFPTESTLFVGLEIIIWLRINGINNPIIAASFAEFRLILSQTKYANILATNACHFMQLPSAAIDDVLINKVGANTFDENNFKHYLKSITDHTKFRHAYANAWGLERLVEVHNEIFTSNIFNKHINKFEKDIHYNCCKYLFNESNRGTAISKTIKSDILSNMSKIYNYIKDKHILYIDDQASTGWADFLIHIFYYNTNNNTISIIGKKTIEESNTDIVNNLYDKFESIYQNRRIDFIISDLRLTNEDENERNYNKFSSVQLMKKIFDAKEEGRLKYKSVRYMLFTASNQLMNYRNLLDKYNKYAPNSIFIKEGLDIQYIEHQKYINYNNLLYSLFSIANTKYRDTDGGIDASVQIAEIKAIEDFQIHLYENTWKDTINSCVNKLNDYTHIICDTNVFLDKKPCVALAMQHKNLQSKHRLTYPVYKELFRNQNNRDEASFAFFSTYFYSHFEEYDENTMTESLCEKSLNKINNVSEFIADDYFIEILSHYIKDQKNKVLFITNDKRDKKGVKAPYTQIENLIKNNKIQNLHLMDLDLKVFKFIPPKVNVSKETNSTKINANSFDQILLEDVLISSKEEITFIKDGAVKNIIIGKNNKSTILNLFKIVDKNGILVSLKKDNQSDNYNIDKQAELISNLRAKLPKTTEIK